MLLTFLRKKIQDCNFFLGGVGSGGVGWLVGGGGGSGRGLGGVGLPLMSTDSVSLLAFLTASQTGGSPLDKREFTSSPLFTIFVRAC